MSGAQDKTASQAITLILGDGGGDPAEQEGADHHAERHAAISSPTVTCCRAETARTARPGPRGRWKTGQPAEKQQGQQHAAAEDDPDHREGRAVPSCPGAGRRLSPQIRTIRPDMPNVAASMPSVRCVPRMATTAAPATKPRIWLAW
jgi:hypothetical protein